MKKIYLLIIAGFFCMPLPAQWVETSSGFSIGGRGLQHMDIVDKDVIWAVAWDGLPQPKEIQEFTKTTDGGLTWVAAKINNTKATYNAAAISAIDENTAWIAMFDTINAGGAILKTTDGGNSWQEQNTATFAAPYGSPTAVHFWDANNGIAMGDPNEADSG